MTDLEELRSVRTADVYADDRLAASLSRTPDGATSFAYRAEYLTDDDARPIATTALARRSKRDRKATPPREMP